MFALTIILGLLVAAAFAGTGTMKLVGHSAAEATRERLGVSPSMWRVIGGLELLGSAGLVVGLWIEGIGIAAAVGLILLLAGAVAAHRKAQDPTQEMLPAILMLVLAVLYLIFRALTV